MIFMVLQLHKKEKKRETFEKYRLCSEMFEAIIITFSRKITVNAKNYRCQWYITRKSCHYTAHEKWVVYVCLWWIDFLSTSLIWYCCAYKNIGNIAIKYSMMQFLSSFVLRQNKFQCSLIKSGLPQRQQKNYFQFSCWA